MSSGLSQPGEKAVEQSGGAGVLLRVGAGRDCGRDRWGPSKYFLLCWSIV